MKNCQASRRIAGATGDISGSDHSLERGLDAQPSGRRGFGAVERAGQVLRGDAERAVKRDLVGRRPPGAVAGEHRADLGQYVVLRDTAALDGPDDLPAWARVDGP